MLVRKTISSISCLFIFVILGCNKDFLNGDINKDSTVAFTVDGVYNGTLSYKNTAIKPKIVINFSDAIVPSEISKIVFESENGTIVPFQNVFTDDNKVLEITPTADLAAFEKFQIEIPATVVTQSGGRIINPLNIEFTTGLDSADKFPRISDDELLTLVQRQTFKYFWEFGHPVSGMARERDTSGDVVATGGTGFGIMGIVTAINRGFITRAEGLARIQRILAFLKTADRFHGAFPHWLNGVTARALPFSAKDDGADIVETSFLMQGLLVARQYFDQPTTAETQLKADVNQLYAAVEWNWFNRDGQNKLLWHWSPNFAWDLNLEVNGYNEALMPFVLGAASSTFPIPKSVYDVTWARNGAMVNGNSYYGIQLPFGPPLGGPLFYEHYSLMAIDPTSLVDAYGNYGTQAVAHSKINYNYCVANPLKFIGYSEDCWGLTASDINGGYAANAPDNDRGYIAPTAAISSIPYTPEESMRALRFFYYKLGDKMWGEYGFKDAFSLNDPWFSNSYIAIDQGPQIVMIENYRTGLIWNLFMSCPEVKTGLTRLGFQSPKI